MSSLDRKLLRDLWRIKGQATAIGLVVAVGVLVLVMMSGLVNSLTETRLAYYDRYRLADVFAPVKRAPERLLGDLAAIPGVATVEGRVQGGAQINLPGQYLPLQAQAISLPDIGAPRLNGVFLTDGRLIDTAHSDEILLLQGFAAANNLKPGDTLAATMNGALRSFRIVGLAQSPEFLYATPPGELVPDDARFAVIWMSRSALSAAYDMTGAFNEALLSLTRDGNVPAVLAAADRVLGSYGGMGAYDLGDQVSNRFVTEEISGLEGAGVAVPPVFLAVAAFLLYIVVARMVEAEREQIGLMKAFGYTDLEVGTHYFKLILAIAAGGAVLGCLGGIVAGRAMTEFYQLYFKFPFLVFEVDPAAFVIGLSISVLTASAGGVFVLRRVFALTPAVAMHAPVPPDYSGRGGIARWLKAVLDQPSRMVLRRITRQPGRMAGAVAGIAVGMGLSVSMISLLTGFDQVLELSFSVIDRSDVTVSFTNPVSERSLYDLLAQDGVIAAEPVRIVPAVLRNGLVTYRGAINGLPPDARLNRAIDSTTATIALPRHGIVLAKALADELSIGPGQMLTVEVREGRRPTLLVPVSGVAETLLGSPAYMDLAALDEALNEPGRISGAYLRIDSARSGAIYTALKAMPAVASVSLKSDARKGFQTTMDQGAGAMRYVMLAVAALITFGIVYNSARIAYAERARDLGSLRVIGFSKGETAFVLLGELAVVTLVALPVGGVLGYFLSSAIARGFSSDLYQIPAIFTPESYGIGAIAVLAAAIVSGWLVKRDVDRADLVAVLKTRE